MNLRRRQFLVWSAASCVAFAGPLVILTAWIVPVRIDPPSTQPSTSVTAASTTPAAPIVNLAELQQLCLRDLRRPLTGESTTNAAPTNAPFTLQLVGIANEPGHSMAMLRKGDGTLAVCALGQSVDDVGGPATVTRIDPDRISITYAGTVRELAMPRTPAIPEGIEP